MPIWVEGDSYMESKMSLMLGEMVGQKVIMTAKGGSEFDSAVERILAREPGPDQLLILWDGFAFGMISPEQTLMDLARVAEFMGDRPWIFIPPVVGKVGGAPPYNPSPEFRDNMIAVLDGAMAKYGPNHVIDPWPILQGLATTEQDFADVAAGFLPRSIYGDDVHMSAAVMQIFAEEISDFVAAQLTGHFIGGSLISDQITGSADGDIVWGWAGRDSITAAAGDDSVRGMDGNDQLYGGDGSDTLLGDVGRDTLSGGAGHDILRGGRGADVFVFAPGDGRDIIQGFSSGTDHIDLSAFDGQIVESLSGSAGDILLLSDAIWIDSDGNGRADVRIRVHGYEAADIIL